MKKSISLLFAPLVLILTACSTHYSASGHSHHRSHGHHSSHVSVGYHGHGGGKVLGALVVGGIIGHVLTEAAHKNDVEDSPRIVSQYEDDDTDTVVNGYPIESEVAGENYPQKNTDVEQWYQLGKDGNCYLMKSVKGQDEIISSVPPYACR